VAKWGWLVVILVSLDQLTKWLAETALTYGERINVFPMFDLTLVYNTGAAFSFLASGSGWQRWVLIAIAIVAIIFMSWLLKHEHKRTLSALSLTLILSGAIGNLIDRVLLGHVIDFLLFYRHNWYFPAFNIADIAISVGAVLLVFDEWRRWREATALRRKGEVP
jgi:signal peptidase II